MQNADLTEFGKDDYEQASARRGLSAAFKSYKAETGNARVSQVKTFHAPRHPQDIIWGLQSGPLELFAYTGSGMSPIGSCQVMESEGLSLAAPFG